MSMEDDLSCREVVELVTEYLENTLLPEMRKHLEEHVAECPGCESFIEQIQLTISMLSQIAQAPVSATTKQRLLQLFQDWKKA
jgi:predicted anti-sigma-YlaC factor YlaD